MIDEILIALIIILVIVLGVYITAILLQRKSQKDLKVFLSEIRIRQGEMGQRKEKLLEYSISEEEPFGSLAKGLKDSFEKLEANLKGLLAEYGQTQAVMRSLSSQEWMAMLRLPVDSLRIRKLVNQLNKQGHGFNLSILDFDQQVEHIQGIGWKIALQSRDSLEKVQTAIHLLNGLRENYIRGDTLEGYLREAKQWEQQIIDIVPGVMLSDTEASVREEARKDTIISVYKLINEIKSLIERNLKQSQDWEQQRSKLDLSLAKLTERFRSISAHIEDLETSKEFPIVWDRSRETLFDIRQQLECLGTIQKKRTLEQLESDYKTAQKLEISILELDAQCQEVQQQHAELLALVSNPEIQEGAAWGREAQKLSYQVQAYDHRNWSNELRLNQISDEIKQFLSYYKNPSWQNANEKIKETELHEILQEIQELAISHQGLRPRVAAVQSRFTEIQTLERQAKDNLSRGKALLNQTISLAGANTVLTGALADLEKLRSEFDPVLNELNISTEGRVEEKAHHVEGLLDQIELTINHWVRKFNQDLTDKRVEVSRKIKTLSEISNLEDPAYLEGVRLLERMPRLPKERDGNDTRRSFAIAKTIREKLAGIDQSEENLPLPEAVGSLKQYNEDWQKCVIALKALGEIEGPVLEMSSKLEQARAAAKQLLTRAGELIPGSRSWPPVNQMLGSERAQMTAIDRKYDALQKEPIKAIQIVTRYGSLADEYQALSNKVRQVVDYAEKDQSRIREQEVRLEEVKTLWKELRNANPGNVRMKDDILILIQGADQQLEAIKDKYRRGGLPYNQALQQIRVLYQNLSNAVVSFDEENMVDINGEVSSRE